MIVKLLGLKISLDLIILLLCLYLVMMIHVFASCCNAETLAEGFKIKSLRNQINKTLDKINGEEDNNKKLEEQKSKLLKQIEEQKILDEQKRIEAQKILEEKTRLEQQQRDAASLAYRQELEKQQTLYNQQIEYQKRQEEEIRVAQQQVAQQQVAQQQVEQQQLAQQQRIEFKNKIIKDLELKKESIIKIATTKKEQLMSDFKREIEADSISRKDINLIKQKITSFNQLMQNQNTELQNMIVMIDKQIASVIAE
jgi:hypothetical protein